VTSPGLCPEELESKPAGASCAAGFFVA